MNWRTTLLLLSAAILSLLFVLGIERPARLARLRSGTHQPVLPAFQSAAVRSIHIHSATGSIALVRSNGLWEVDGPLRRLAQQSLVDALLSRISNLKGRSVLTSEELRERPRAASDFGLSPPAARLLLESDSGRTEILLGTRNLNRTQVYYQVLGLPGIFTAEADLLDHLPLVPEGWRDAALLPLDRLVFDRIRVASPTGAFSLNRDSTNGLWEMIEPRPARVDSARVGLLLRQLGMLQIARFLPRTSTPPAEVAGLRPAQLVLTLARGSNEVYSLTFGSSLTNAPSPAVYAQRPGEPDLLVVPAEAHDLLRIPYKDLLDRRLVRFDRNAVNEIAMSGGSGFQLTRGTNGWSLAPGVIKADAPLAERFLNHLAALEMIEIAKEVVTDLDLANYGLAPPRQRITLRARPGDTNSVLAQLEIGALRDNHTFARVPGEPPVYLVNPGDVDDLPKTPWDLRDRSLWKFESSQVSGIDVRHEGVEWSIRRQGTNDWSVPPGARNEINGFALEEALHRLGTARIAAWRGLGNARATSLGIGKGPDVTLEFRGQPTQPPLKLRFGKSAPNGHRYAALPQPDGSLPVFELPGTVFDDLWRESGMSGQTTTEP